MEGYDKLALLFSKYPELAAFRRFRRATMKCLLYKQAELTYLEYRMDDIASFNKEENEKLATSYLEFSQAPGDDVDDQRKFMADLEAKIRSYYELLKMTCEMLKIDAADPGNIGTLRDWLGRREGGNNFLAQDGSLVEGDPWLSSHEDDLVTLEPPSPDKFADHVSKRILPRWHHLIGVRFKKDHDPDLGPIWPYERKKITFAGNIICMLLSFSIPTASIFGLNYLNTMRDRLIMVAAFILLFAFAMMFVVGSRRGEVFAATAAFAAIQVVFVGSVNIGQNG